MASKSKIAMAKRKPKFSSRLVRRCQMCGRPRAVYDQDLADVLDGRRVQCRADFAEELRARGVFGGHHADLDEFVADKVAVDFVHHRGREPAIADHDHGMERVCARAQ